MAKNKVIGDDVALYLFHQGNNMKAYEYMGAHKVKGEDDLYSFRLWAPHAERVSVNGRAAKASYDVKLGDLITVSFGSKSVTVKVLDIRETTKKTECVGMYEIVSES